MQAIRDGADAVIAVGGDGTLHEVFHFTSTENLYMNLSAVLMAATGYISYLVFAYKQLAKINEFNRDTNLLIEYFFCTSIRLGPNMCQYTYALKLV